MNNTILKLKTLISSSLKKMRRTKSNPKINVSSHAVLRYVERFFGIDWCSLLGIDLISRAKLGDSKLLNTLKKNLEIDTSPVEELLSSLVDIENIKSNDETVLTFKDVKISDDTSMVQNITMVIKERTIVTVYQTN